MEKIKEILEQQIKREVAMIDNIGKYPEMYQPNAELFYIGRKRQAEEILAKIISSNLHHEKKQFNKPIICCLPSHAHLTEKALEVHGDDESELNMAKHKAWIDGGVWMLDECIKYLESEGK